MSDSTVRSLERAWLQGDVDAGRRVMADRLRLTPKRCPKCYSGEAAFSPGPAGDRSSALCCCFRCWRDSGAAPWRCSDCPHGPDRDRPAAPDLGEPTHAPASSEGP